jgi:hypothetical protein
MVLSKSAGGVCIRYREASTWFWLEMVVRENGSIAMPIYIVIFTNFRYILGLNINL